MYKIDYFNKLCVKCTYRCTLRGCLVITMKENWKNLLNTTAESSLAKLGEHIKFARKKRGLSVLELSQRIGVDRRSLAQLEKGAPGSSIGLLFVVLDQFDLLKGFDAIVNPSLDVAAIEMELKQARGKQRIKKIADEKVDF